MSDDITPARVIRETWRWLPAWVVVLAVVLLAGGAVTWAGSAFNWWLSAQTATHQAENTQNGYSNQVTLRQQVTSQLAAVYSLSTRIAEASGDQSLIAALKPQRMAVAGIVCSDAAQVTGTPLPSQQAAWVSANCDGANVSTSSTYYQAGQS